MESLFLFIALIVSLLINALQLKFHYKEKEDIFAKFMAKSLSEAEYYKKAYPGKVKEDQKRMEKDRKTELTEEQKNLKAVAEKF